MSCILLRARCCAVLVGFVVAAVHTRTVSATIISTQSFGGKTYHLLDASSWTAAQTEAQTLNGNLVTINSLEEHNFVYSTFGPLAIADAGTSYTGKINLWLGTNDADAEGTWTWISGLPSSYSNWFDDQPQDTYGDEDYGGIRVRGRNASVPVGKWIDIVSDGRLGDLNFGVVEVTSGSAENPPTPEPSTFVLAALGGAAVIGYRLKRRKANR
jgi:hypothetical protein